MKRSSPELAQFMGMSQGLLPENLTNKDGDTGSSSQELAASPIDGEIVGDAVMGEREIVGYNGI